MTQDFLSSSFRYRQVLGVTDMADVIAAFRDEVLNQLSTPWTEPSQNTFRSPEDELGHFFTVVLGSSDPTRLQATVKDANGVTLTTRVILADVGGNPVNIFTGQFHFFVESEKPGYPEVLGGGLLDVSPEAVAIPEYRAWQCGHRNSTGVVGNQSWPELVMMDGNQPWMSARADTGDPGGSGAQPNKTCAGVFLYTPVMVCTNVATSDPRWICRLYQCLRCSDELGPGSEVAVPVDAGVTGSFRVIGRDAAGGCRMCVRKS